MALPLSGQISFSQIRAELGMSGTTNFSLIKASTSAPGYPILNPYSPVPPLTQITNPPYSMGDWRGYSSATIYWTNNILGFGASRLQIYVNGILRVDNTNNFDPLRNGTLAINDGDTFYATMTPITFSSSPPNAFINTFRYSSPFGLFNFTLLNTTTNSTLPPFNSFSSPTQTAIIQPVNLAVFEIDTSC